MLNPGTIVAGYRVDGVLGEGGMGAVYNATQLSLNRTIALKVLATDLSSDPTFRERFRREGLLQAQIEHPNIVTVYEAGETEHGLFLAMRVVRGPTLKELILDGSLDPARTVRILRPVAEALDTAHEVGLIHRDVKPQNILLGARDHPYLADFGLTKAPDEAGRLTDTGQFVGTIDYVSPEQMRGEGATSASDVYALAGVFYECLTSEVPFSKPSEAAVLFAHMTEEPPKPTAKRPELPPEIDEVIAKGMAKEPNERQATASDFLRDAARALGVGAADTTQSAIPGGAGAGEGPGAPTAAAGVPAPAGATVRAGTPTAPAKAPIAAGAPTKAAAAATAPPATAAPSHRRLIGALVAAAVAAAVAGFVLGSSGSDEGEEAFTSSASAGDVELSFPDGWERVGGGESSIPGLEPASPLVLAPAGGGADSVVAGTVSPVGPLLLPPSFTRLLSGTPRGQAVRLGGAEALRYTGLRPRGLTGTATVFAVPTSNGVVTVACREATPAFTTDCGRVAETLKLTGAKALPLGPSEAYAEALGAAITKLDSSRAAGLKALRSARSQSAQAAAARRVSRAYANAAAAVGRAPAGPAEAAPTAALRRALTSAGRAYAQLASAAARDNAGAYRAAGRSVRRAQRQATQAVAELKQLGYDVG